MIRNRSTLDRFIDGVSYGMRRLKPRTRGLKLGKLSILKSKNTGNARVYLRSTARPNSVVDIHQDRRLSKK